MKYYRISENCESRLVVSDGDAAYDLTSAHEGVTTLDDLYQAADRAGTSPDDLAGSYLSDAREVDLRTDNLQLPVVPSEVWAAGVTYEISEEARQEESEDPDVYMKVYRSERPELFLKSTPHRTVGPNDEIGIRGDSEWDVPEPELGVVLYRGDIVGYTIGNDVSSRSIEGENPLYLPQAKVYDRSCSLGPCVASTDSIADPHDLEMTMTIRRDGDPVFSDSTSTGEMVRTCEDLTSYLTRHNSVPDLTVLLTGTALVPEGDFTLRPRDEVEIHIEDLGTLTNTVTSV